MEDFARYLYLPRLQSSAVLVEAIRSGIGLLTWEQDAFAYADGYDEAGGRYRGLRAVQQVAISDADSGVLVKPTAARVQLDTEAKTAAALATEGGTTTATPRPGGAVSTPVSPATAPKPRRFHGTVVLDPTRTGRDAGRIADEVIAHLSGLVGAEVTVTLDIHAEIPGGVPETVVRTVTENARTLKFSNQGFETE
jgi:hypothetical protein